jgi:hypothetical protein
MWHARVVCDLHCRYLYYDMLQSCYLFQGVPSKMIIAILSAARIEKYLPQVGASQQQQLVCGLVPSGASWELGPSITGCDY